MTALNPTESRLRHRFQDGVTDYVELLAPLEELSENSSTLLPGYAGIRPKIHAPGEAACDFVIQGPAVHGVAGLVNLFGIESPGLTSALAIGESVGQIVASAYSDVAVLAPH